jgi:hypothetical protein
MRKNWGYFFLSFIVFLLILGGSMFLMFSDIPERVEVTSEDGKVTLVGFARESQGFDMEVLPLDSHDVFQMGIYKITPSRIQLDQPVDISFTNSEGLALYRYDDDFLAWRIVQESIYSEGHLILQTDRLGDFALGAFIDVSAPSFLTVFDELLEQAPEQTVGYQMLVGYELNDVIIEIPQTHIQGGCNGFVHQGNKDEITILRRSARVLVDDVEELVDFVFIAHWLVSDANKCTQEDLAIVPNVIE